MKFLGKKVWYVSLLSIFFLVLFDGMFMKVPKFHKTSPALPCTKVLFFS